jgi:hypothetical protein
MSLFMGVDKLSFLEKYTEEKEINGQNYAKLKHKTDLSCILLDIGKECYSFRLFDCHPQYLLVNAVHPISSHLIPFESNTHYLSPYLIQTAKNVLCMVPVQFSAGPIPFSQVTSFNYL